MSVKLRKIDEQVMVITGATSGIGLATARLAADCGAKLVLAARSSDALDQLASELRQKGNEVATVAADVGMRGNVERIGQMAMERFGRIDTWFNNAGINVYGNCQEVPLEDQHRVLQTNFWGSVYGSLEAVKRMKSRGGGALINMGSEVSDRAVPLQGAYCASKQALKAFTDALRLELEQENAPISVTLVRPSSVDTMLTLHAKNYMDKEPVLPGPVYAPELIAETILHVAEHPRRDVFVGARSKFMSVAGVTAPRLMDHLMRAFAFREQQSGMVSAPCRRDALYAPDNSKELHQRHGVAAHVKDSSAYTSASLYLRPLTAAVLGGTLFAALRLARRLGR